MDQSVEPQPIDTPRLWSRGTTAVIAALVLLGVATRVAQYAFGRSLWFDELLLALNIQNRDFSGLLEPLNHGQFAPIGFLLSTKAAVLALGPSEQAFRLVAFVTGVGALLVFVPLVRRLASPAGCILAVGLFACLPRLVFYSNEFKQYSTELFAVTVVLLLTLWLWESDRRWWRWLVLAIVGAALQLMSLTVIFALGASAMVVTIDQLWRRQWRGAAAGTAVGLLWAAQFAGFYLLFYRYGSQSDALNSFWAEAFMPRPIASMDTAKWLIESWYQLIPSQGGRGGGGGLQVERLSGVLGLLMLAGIVELGRRSPRVLALLLMPLVLLLLAAGLQAYPIYSRLVLFAAVIILSLVAVGGGVIFDLVARHNRAMAVLLLATTLFFSTAYALLRLARPIIYQESRQVLAQLAEQHQPGQPVFLTHNSRVAFDFYRARVGFAPEQVSNATPVAGDVLEQIDRYVAAITAYPEVWVLTFHGHSVQGIDDITLLHLALERRGQRVNQIAFDRCSATLYRFPPDADQSTFPPVQEISEESSS